MPSWRRQQCLNEGFACVSFFFSLWKVQYIEQTDRRHRMNFNTVELEVLAEELSTHSVKQGEEKNVG